MYPNLLGQKALNKLTNDDLAGILNISRGAFEKKIKNGNFTANECWILCSYFKKSFEYLFKVEYPMQ